MSRITFLDNAHNGKNNWWRYLFTSILTLGGGKILAMIILPIFIYIFFYFLVIFGFITTDWANAIISNPFFGLIIIGIIYSFNFSLFYLLLRFIHRKKIINLVNTVSRVSLRKIIKGAGIWLTVITLVTLLSLMTDPGSFKVTFNLNNFFILLILSLIVFSIQAPFEELFFRGYLMQGFGLLSKKPVIPLLATSVIFAALHYWNSTNTMMSVDIVMIFSIGVLESSSICACCS